MNRYNQLLARIADTYHISKGLEESKSQYMERIIYSLCALMAYASLWERAEEEISITHLKRRIRETLSNYIELYPEFESVFAKNSSQLEDEIYDIFLNAGVVYHNPYRIRPAGKKEAGADRIVFQRGISLDAISHVSGIGFYSKQRDLSDFKPVSDMFGLESRTLQDIWKEALSDAVWKEERGLDNNVEFLRTKPPFTSRYWNLSPDRSGVVSMLRTNEDETARRYYLYYYDQNEMKVSLLPDWQTQKMKYLQLAWACLLEKGILPSIDYYEDGPLVHIKLNYLLSPRELAFLKLYSWPEKMSDLSNPFERKLSSEVFFVIKSVLESKGYIFKGVTKTDAKWCEFSSQTA